MTDAPYLDDIDPVAETVRKIDEPDPIRASLRAADPIVQVDAPAGGRVWIVTDEIVARDVLSDQRFAKDPTSALRGWGRDNAGLEPTAAERTSLTTLDGPDHARLRRVHELARQLLTTLAEAGTAVDLMSDFTVRFPLTVLLDLLGVPLDRVDEATVTCQRMFSTEPGEQAKAVDAIAENGML